MKTRFSTIDLVAAVSDIKSRYLGLRVVNVYDIDHKTYLVRLGSGDDKSMLLLESGNRIHSTEFDWPKNTMPSGFSMKLRKHLRSRRLENVTQLGVDRVVDLQFGSGEAAYHIILELYDRGNIVLTDYEYTILNILRPRTDQTEDVKFVVREKYPVNAAKTAEPLPDVERLRELVLNSKANDTLKKALNPHFPFGPAVIEHCLSTAGFPDNAKQGKGFDINCDIPRVLEALREAEGILATTISGACKGYIIQKKDKKTKSDGDMEELLTYNEFHPFIFRQHENLPSIEFQSFSKAVDEFFSKLESQKLDLKALEQEKAAMKKLQNVRNDHMKRLESLHKTQEEDEVKAYLIEVNKDLVEHAIQVVRSAIANQIDWTEINNIIQEARNQGDPVAKAIKKVKLEVNHITMMLRDPFAVNDPEVGDSDAPDQAKQQLVDIDLNLGAYTNARRYYDEKRSAMKKEQKTIESSEKAVKSATRKTKQMLKDVALATSINKTRKTYWFEKFFWFLTSENYLVIGGRDQQQNEIVVKKYLRPGDVYVHADLHGASSVIIKNPAGRLIPPKTMNEAGTMAICYSQAWDAKVVTSAWWVYHDQVSKTAPTGEYLTTGSFMVRGKKNYLPPSYLVMGFGFMFKLDESSVQNHKGERSVRVIDDDESLAPTEESNSICDDEHIEIDDDDNDNDNDDNDVGESSNNEVENSEQDHLISDQLTGMSTLNGQSNIAHVEDETEKYETKEELSDVDDDDDDTAAGDDESVAEESDVEKASDEEEQSLFPDTVIELQHVKGDIFQLQRSVSNSTAASDDPETRSPATSESSTKKHLSAKQRRELKKNKKQDSAADGQTAEQAEKPESTKSETPVVQATQPKRGQKSKQKKIKEKYKDQDEDEREIRMEILASKGTAKESTKKGKKGSKGGDGTKQTVGQKPKNQARKLAPFSAIIHVEEGDDVTVNPEQVMNAKQEDNVAEELEQVNISDDVDVLDSLTGCPLEEDLLMFAVPVCAPYSAMASYKFKVKLVPGNNKRGKAAKTALDVFIKDRSAHPREKDLLKVVKDTDLSRNIPGKVKMAAANLQNVKKKRK